MTSHDFSVHFLSTLMTWCISRNVFELLLKQKVSGLTSKYWMYKYSKNNCYKRKILTLTNSTLGSHLKMMVLSTSCVFSLPQESGFLITISKISSVNTKNGDRLKNEKSWKFVKMSSWCGNEVSWMYKMLHLRGI